MAYENLIRLAEVMDRLRSPGGCPWDAEQTHESLLKYLLEESYEFIESIESGNRQDMQEELGDILLQVYFHARIAQEHQSHPFNLDDVAKSVADKLISRHPHIYGDVTVQDEEEVKSNGEKLKLKEGKKSVLEGVPKSLPAMVKAQRIQDKARGVGFDWEHEDQVWEKVQEELAEFKAEADHQTSKMEDEFGDVLFALINYARFKGINPEDALERTNKKFIRRFQYLETASAQDGKKMGEMTLEEMDVYWNQAKKEE